MTVSSGSVCTRCGKPRIIVDSYQEKVETSVVTYTTAVCSDPECQKIVDKNLKEEERKRVLIKNEQDARLLIRKGIQLQKKKTASV